MNRFGVISTSKGLQVFPYEQLVDSNVWFSGTETECNDYIKSVYDHTGQDAQELDPRDYDRVDDFGDPCS